MTTEATPSTTVPRAAPALLIPRRQLRIDSADGPPPQPLVQTLATSALDQLPVCTESELATLYQVRLRQPHHSHQPWNRPHPLDAQPHRVLCPAAVGVL